MAIHTMRPGMSRKGLRGWRGRGLGTIAVPVAGGQIYGSDAVGRTSMIRPMRPTNGISQRLPVISPAWGSGYRPPVWGASIAVSSGMNLAQLQQLAQSNPAALTPSQIMQLQAAGTLPGTLPTTSGALISTGSGAIDPATGQTYVSELASAQTALTTAAGTTTPSALSSILGTDPMTGSTTIFGVDWYWLAGVAVALYMFTRRGRR